MNSFLLIKSHLRSVIGSRRSINMLIFRLILEKSRVWAFTASDVKKSLTRSFRIDCMFMLG